MNEIAKPTPAITPAMQPFYDGAARHELWIQRCSACGTYRFPARDLCSHCLSPQATWERACGRGEIYSFTILHQIYHPAFAAEVPYAVVIVQLDEGPRLTSNLIEVAPNEVRIGARVEVAFRTFGEVTLPVFAPVAEPA